MNPSKNDIPSTPVEPVSGVVADQKISAVPPPKNHRGRSMILLTLAFIFFGLAWLLSWLFYFRFYEYTDDAYVNGNRVNVTSVVSGTPIAFYADDTDLVLEGQLLVKLDTTPYEIAYEKELAGLKSSVLQVQQLRDTLQVQLANVESKKIALSKASYDLQNRQQLVVSKAVSEEEYTHAKDEFSIAEFSYKQALAQYHVSKDAYGLQGLNKHPLIEVQKAALRQAYYNLKHCDIYAPSTGYVAKRAVQVGQWVTSSTYLMAVIPLESMWVDANYKETQLKNMRIGQPVTVTFDIYGSGVEFEGRVLGIASGTGSVFSLIPPQNATGNWIKIVQRLPVRIGLDVEKMKDYPLRLGLSAEVYVDIARTDLPLLAQEPAKKVIATTDVFEIDYKDLDKVIEQVVNGK